MNSKICSPDANADLDEILRVQDEEIERSTCEHTRCTSKEERKLTSDTVLPRTRVIIIILLTNEVSTVSIKPVYICNGILHAVKVPFLFLNLILVIHYISTFFFILRNCVLLRYT